MSDDACHDISFAVIRERKSTFRRRTPLTHDHSLTHSSFALFRGRSDTKKTATSRCGHCGGGGGGGGDVVVVVITSSRLGIGVAAADCLHGLSARLPSGKSRVRNHVGVTPRAGTKSWYSVTPPSRDRG